MAKKATGKRAPARKAKVAKATAAKPKSMKAKPRQRKAVRLKPASKQVKADVKAALGAIPPWTPAEVEEAFRRFQAANAEPKG